MSHCSATRGLLVTDLIILNHGQVTWTTPELAPPPNYHTTPTGRSAAASPEENVHNPTDFMNKLATWDRCHSMDEMLEKRRRAVWTLEIFENYGANEGKTERLMKPSDS
ncbi:hypothetical protein TNCV_1448441 [Trichonephila clavipes]|nr:hypothetical protein TNCV_1448441 [Trichonephila clavipes]